MDAQGICPHLTHPRRVGPQAQLCRLLGLPQCSVPDQDLASTAPPQP